MMPSAKQCLPIFILSQWSCDDRMESSYFEIIFDRANSRLKSYSLLLMSSVKATSRNEY